MQWLGVDLLVVAELSPPMKGSAIAFSFSRFLQTPKIFVYLMLLGVVGLSLDLVFRAFNRRAFHWATTDRR